MSLPSPYLAQALQYFRNGAYPQAIALLQKAVAERPQHFESRLQLAKACLDWVQMLARTPLTDIEPDKLGAEAAHYLQLFEGNLQILVKSHPASPHVQGMLAMLHLVHARPAEALCCLKKVLTKEPKNPDVLYNMGYALMELENYAEAEKQFKRLVTFYPEHGMGWHMLGEASRLANHFEASLPAYGEAIGLLPGMHQPYGALASALKRLGRHEEAAEVLRKGLGRHPDVRDLNFALAALSLSIGDWATGWRYHASRDRGTFRPPFADGYVIPLPADRPVRVHCDQGLGDELFFLRFLPSLVRKGMTVQYTTQKKLAPLLQGMPEISSLKIMEPDQPKTYDVLVGDLPYLVGMRSAADIPPSLTLPLDAERVAVLREELAGFGPAPYLGVTWQGGTIKTLGGKGIWRSLHKEIPPALLGKLLRDWPGTVVVLQRLPKADDMASFVKALGRSPLDWSRLNDDLADASAGLSLLDEYVGVSNTNMHLMAGIGRTARVLVPQPADWRWMATGEESPWFPGFRIYRQTNDDAWNEALAKLGQDLKRKYN